MGCVGRMRHGTFMEIRGELAGVRWLLLQCGFLGTELRLSELAASAFTRPAIPPVLVKGQGCCNPKGVSRSCLGSPNSLMWNPDRVETHRLRSTALEDRGVGGGQRQGGTE